MNARRKRLLRLLTALALAGFAALNALAFMQSRAMLHYAEGGLRTAKPEALSPLRKAVVLLTGTRVPRPHGTGTPADHRLPYDSLSIPVAGDLKLGAWFCPAPAATNVMVLLFHGYAQDKSAGLSEAAALHDLGLPVLLVDFRGSGDSTAAHTTIGFEEGEDVAAAVHYARERFPGARLILYGQSMGAAAILRAVAHHGVKPEGVVLEAVFDSLLYTVRNRFRAMKVPSFPAAECLVFWGGVQFGFNGFSLKPVEDARSLRCPALFFHGTGDPRARPEEGERVRKAIPHRSSFLVSFPSASHDDTAVRHPDLWRKGMLALLPLTEAVR